MKDSKKANFIRPETRRNFARDIRQLYRKNAEGRQFVPDQTLFKLMTEVFVSNACSSCGVPLHQMEEVISIIMSGARKVFAVLILISAEPSILRFIENDQFSKSCLDDKMPFNMDALNGIMIDQAIPSDFFQQQWVFATPLFLGTISHRLLDDNIIVPFEENKKVGEGSFGVIYEVTLHSSYQRFHEPPEPEEKLKLIRKCFKPNTNDSGLHERENELRNLATLKLLKDPCIVQLLGSYTYREEHNFLFPLATGGDLAKLLHQEPPPAEFDSDEKFLLALLGLATALHKVHDFSYETVNLKLIGCHHDLKPSNVLVHDGRFLLADFGLSKFKPLVDGSKTMFKLGGDHYLAPECEEYEGDFERHTINRAADIWSFGCIISEIATYMSGGSTDVELFKKSRRITIGRFTTYTFHAGYNKPHDGVHSWLSRLEAATTRPRQLLVQLVREMLSVDPENRPKAIQVSSQISYIACYELFQACKSLLFTITNKINSFEVEMELIKFESCGFVLGMLDIFNGIASTEGPVSHDVDTGGVFKSANPLSELLQMREELTEINLLETPIMRLRLLRVRHLVDQFMMKLPETIRGRAESQLASTIAISDDIEFLQSSKELFQDIPTYRRIALLASIKQTTLLAAKRSKMSPEMIQISGEAIQIKETFETSNIALISRNGLLEWALIEWLYYDCDINEEVHIRVESIAELFAAEKPTEFLALDCAGFYHDISKPGFGLAFLYPEQFRMLSCTSSPLSLAKFVERSRDASNRPLLGDRFTLAYRLAVSVLEYHKVGWLHRSLSSFSVILFYPKNAVSFTPESIRQPFIIGFSHSRPDEVNAYTRGPKDNEREEYQHPDYAEHRAPFSARFDYYSLGIILLEIGLWQGVVELRQRWKIPTARKLRTELMKRRVPLLGHSMGQKYLEAVQYCLSNQADHLTDPKQLHLTFEHEVVEKLASCSA